MTALYITSLTEHAGKTMLCAGLGKTWQSSGKKVGYLKLRVSNAAADKDAEFVKQVLGLKEPMEALSPSVESKGYSQVIKSYQKVAPEKDVVLIDGLSLNASGSLIESLNSKVLVVHDYSSPLISALPEYKKSEKRLLGVVLNKVPRRKLAAIQSQAAADLSPAGISFLGAIPEDRVLLGMTVAELAELLQGKILSNAEKSPEVIEALCRGL
jgi:BioD-like phosphotransacetylase family protein